MANNSDIRVTLVGNPNVGKSTVFNALTGLKQHTGNWAGKTVSNAQGEYIRNGRKVIMYDLPGTYSLMAHSVEERAARSFIAFGKTDVTVVVCDASCLERNLILALQTMEITPNVILCINLMDEAKKKNIAIDTDKLQKELNVPIIKTAARSKKGLDELADAIEQAADSPLTESYRLSYTKEIETAAGALMPVAEKYFGGLLPVRFAALRLLEGNRDFINEMCEQAGLNEEQKAELSREKSAILEQNDIRIEKPEDKISSCTVLNAESVCCEAVTKKSSRKTRRDGKIDRILTGRFTAVPIMILMLTVILWITVVGANYPSSLLSGLFGWIEEQLAALMSSIGIPDTINSMLTEGVFRVLAWVVAVMLPPMAIFFPLFTLLEDFGVLPRIAFNLDKYFKKAGACGKQALSMCMSLGCNACGVTGARIIDSKRERIIAVLTSSMVPCNGKFPIIISLFSIFIIGTGAGIFENMAAALGLVSVLVIGVAVTLMCSKLLSATLLKGEPSSFTIELPSYRRPQIGKVLVRSFLDRTLFVLGRAVTVAAPAGLIIWIIANVSIDGSTLLSICTDFLDPAGRLLGMDGVILFAFILGFPANETVVPIIIMAYAASTSLSDTTGTAQLAELLTANGWTVMTAICVILFSMFHFPCSTTCLTIYKETKSIKWTAAAVILPTAVGVVLCMALNAVWMMFA
ncbi:MAG: ferrous iron transport protein B [Eubacterium sp.]|nr:ferrous iron transport protein B [Eubacterium sp.]